MTGALFIAAHYASALNRKTNRAETQAVARLDARSVSSSGASPCVQSQAFRSDQQTLSTAALPQENVLTAHLPLTTKAGSLAPLNDSTQASLERLCTILQDLAMSGCVSDTPPTMCAPVHISFDDLSAPSTANNGSTPRWTAAQSLGGSNSKERGKLLLLSELRKRRS